MLSAQLMWMLFKWKTSVLKPANVTEWQLSATFWQMFKRCFLYLGQLLHLWATHFCKIPKDLTTNTFSLSPGLMDSSETYSQGKKNLNIFIALFGFTYLTQLFPPYGLSTVLQCLIWFEIVLEAVYLHLLPRLCNPGWFYSVQVIMWVHAVIQLSGVGLGLHSCL